MINLVHFNYSEFDSPDEPGSGKKMKDSFMQMLERARTYANTPFIINSGYRTKEHNARVGGSKTSSHLYGFAADIACTDPIKREKIIFGLIHAGFQRLGIAKTFIHVDNDPKKNPAIWVYPINHL